MDQSRVFVHVLSYPPILQGRFKSRRARPTDGCTGGRILACEPPMTARGIVLVSFADCFAGIGMFDSGIS